MSLLTVITERDTAVPLARLAWHVARAVELDLTLLFLERGEAAEPVAGALEDEAPKSADAAWNDVRGALLALRPAAGDPEGAEAPPVEGGAGAADAAASEAAAPAPEIGPRVQLVQLTTPKAAGAVLDWIRQHKIEMLVVAHPRGKQNDETAALTRELYTTAPCRTMVVRLGEAEAERCERILVPTAGGGNSRLALRLAGRLAGQQEGGRVTALNVEPPEVELATEVGESVLDRALQEAELAGKPWIKTRVALADHRDQGIRQVAGEGFDLLLIGATRHGVWSRHLFGKIPAHLLADETPTVVAVVREGWPWLDRAQARFGRWLERAVPQLSREQRKDLYERLQVGSRWNFDFQLLIALSTAIAALGLLQDSGAVVIGAMLVAPLMTPILGAGLSLVQGNLPLLRTAAHSLIGGYLLALAVGFVLGLVVRLPRLTAQLLARGEPTLLDMGVAFLAGYAAAHCLGRPGLIAALPGVAIAAALVPPIATTGICLAQNELATAQGAALLFGTNVVSIVIGAAASLYASGLRGKNGASRTQHWVRLIYALLFIGAIGLVFPLGSSLVAKLRPVQLSAVPAPMMAEIDTLLAVHPGVERLSVRRSRQPAGIEITLLAPAPPIPALARELARRVQRYEPGVDVRIKTEIAIDVRAADLEAELAVAPSVNTGEPGAGAGPAPDARPAAEHTTGGEAAGDGG